MAMIQVVNKNTARTVLIQYYLGTLIVILIFPIMKWISLPRQYMPLGLMFGLAGIPAIFLYHYWYQRVQLKRLLENTPTSKISTGAIGTHVEIEAPVFSDKNKTLKGPLSGNKCASYMVLISMWGETSNSVLDKVNPLAICTPDGGLQLAEGDKGLAVVHPFGAGMSIEKDATKTIEFRSKESSVWKQLKIGEREKNIILPLGPMISPLIATEYCFQPEDTLYIFGFAESGLKKFKAPKPSFKNYLKAKTLIQSKSDLTERFDTNKDGNLDSPELEEGSKILGMEIGNNEKAIETKPEIRMVFRNSTENFLYLTDGGEGVLQDMLAKDAKKAFWQAMQITAILLYVAINIFIKYGFSR